MDRHQNIAPLLGALGIALVPYAPRLPWWVVLWCIVCWGYVFVATRYRLPKPGKILCLVLTIGGACAMLLTSGINLDRDSSVALLWIMVSIKSMEIRTHRDEMVIIFLIYFLAVSCLFFSSNLSVGLYMAFSICMTTAVLIHLHHPHGKLTGKLGMSAKLMLKALPLGLILFIVFPRMQGSLWGIHSRAQAFSGFADRLAPGFVSHLVRNNTIAFRAEFKNRIPAADRLYWRGLVFWRFDGRAWQGRNNPLNVQMPINVKNAIEYTVTLEPHNNRWLFALDLPYESEPDAVYLSDHTLISRWTVRQRFRYTVKSYTSYRTGPLREWEAAAVQIPQNTNPQAVALARKWRAESESPAQIVNSALQFFRKNGFTYSLKPPPLGEEPIDDFLFRTRKGYCEHYASAFAFLMRAAGVPARIVAGYLGGELNPYGKYLVVRQSDAHVWAEVWLPDNGWIRVDPTSSVAPQRVEQGMAAALPPEERSAFRSYTDIGPFSAYWINLQLGWDAVNNQWNKWILGYSNYRQKTLLAKIGIKTDIRTGWAKAFFMGAGVIGLIALLYFIRMFKKSSGTKDAVQQVYLAFCVKLERIGLARKPFQGPLDYARTVIAARRDLKSVIVEIINLYMLLRYGRGGDKDALKRLKTLVRQFNP